MKNKSQQMNQRSQTKVLDWLYQEEENDDFLLGKTPRELQDIEDDEE
jgi:hypothetical protein